MELDGNDIIQALELQRNEALRQAAQSMAAVAKLTRDNAALQKELADLKQKAAQPEAG